MGRGVGCSVPIALPRSWRRISNPDTMFYNIFIWAKKGSKDDQSLGGSYPIGEIIRLTSFGIFPV